jgi:hypothetical protein
VDNWPSQRTLTYRLCVPLVKRSTKMIIEIKKSMSKADIQKALSSIPTRKKLNARQFLGTVKWPEDPIAYQKRMRDEW